MYNVYNFNIIFGVEFLKFFWSDLGHFVVRSLNTGFALGQLSSTQKEGVITCIPKGSDKSKHLLKNWRPISLLNVSYKLASAAIAERIKIVLGKLIHEDQTGFISGRNMSENIRVLYDLFCYTKLTQKPGLLLLIDFEKAFDSLSWKFIQKVLSFFNFGFSIKRWFEVFYKNIKSCVIVNGQASSWFEIQRGCRQGDPLSPYIFVLCVEILALMARQNKEIKGVCVDNKEYLISQYADDTSITLDGSELSLRSTLKLLKFFAKVSGLRVNIEKTKAVWFGSKTDITESIQTDENLFWSCDTFRFLGVSFHTNLDRMVSQNYDNKLKEIKKLLEIWSRRNLTPYGRVTVLKTLAVSKLTFLLLSLPNPPKCFLDELNTMFFKFLWQSQCDRIKRNRVVLNYNQGGLKMINIYTFCKSLKLSSLIKYTCLTTKSGYLFNAIYPNLKKFAHFGENFVNLSLIKNAYWLDVFQSFFFLIQKLKESCNNETFFLNQPIWFNSNLEVGGKSMFIKDWYDNGIRFVKDMYTTDGDIIGIHSLQNNYGIKTNFLEYNGVRSVLRKYQRKVVGELVSVDCYCPAFPIALNCIMKSSKDISGIFNDIIQSTKAEQKWIVEFDLPQNFNWKHVYTLPYFLTKDPKLRWLQFRIINRIISTNTFLKKIGLCDTDLCHFCNLSPETLSHLLWECSVVKNFWNVFELWLRRFFPELPFDMSYKVVLFGISSCSKNVTLDLINLFLLLAKQYIFSTKYDSGSLSIVAFSRHVFMHYKTVKYLAKKNFELNDFREKWHIYEEIEL